MPNFAANLTMLFTELPMLKRFQAAANCGFKAVEILFPYEHEASELADKLRDAGLKIILINFPAGDWPNERGFSAIPGRENEFRENVAATLQYAQTIGCQKVHIMAGVVEDGLKNTRAVDTYLSNLTYAAEIFGEKGITVVIEPLNARSAPGYLISHQWEARDIIKRVGHDNLGLQFDFFHAQIMEGDLATRLQEFLPIIRHIQIAGVPERHEPDTGEVNYSYLFDLLDELKYDEWVGCEYVPKTTTEEGLGWFHQINNRNVG